MKQLTMSEDTLQVAYHCLRSTRRTLKDHLMYTIPNGKMSTSRIPILEHQLAEVETAIKEIEEVLDSLVN